MAITPLEAILAAIFEADFCPREEKQVRLQERDQLLKYLQLQLQWRAQDLKEFIDIRAPTS